MALAAAVCVVRKASSWSARASSLAASIATAVSAAFAAPASPMAKVATGTPLGICRIDSMESSPRKYFDGTGTPSTGTMVIAATMPDRWAAPPAPAMMARKPRARALFAYAYISSGMRCAEMTCASYGTPNCFRMATAFCITSQSEDEPMMTPTSGLGFNLCSLISGLQLLARQAFDGFKVLGLGFFDDVGRQRRRRCGLAPGQCFQVVAHELLVERRRRDAGLIGIGRPEARGVGRQHFIHQVHDAVVVEAEFEFGVGDDDAARGRVLGRGLVQCNADVAHLGGQFGTDASFHVGKADVFIMLAQIGLGRRGEQWLRQLFSLLQAGWQLDAADAARILIIFPARTDDVTAHHRLDHDGFQSLGDHGTALHLFHFLWRYHRFRRHAGQMIRHDMTQFLEPEVTHLIEDLALAWDR